MTNPDPASYGSVLPTTGPANPVNVSLKRPRMLLALLSATALTAVAGIIGAITVFAGGRRLADSAVMASIGNDQAMLAMSDDLRSSLVDEAYTTLSARAIFALVLVAWLLLAGLFARNAGRVARALLTVGAVLTFLLDALIVADIRVDVVTPMSIVSMVLAVVVLALCWLPPNNRFARAWRIRPRG